MSKNKKKHKKHKKHSLYVRQEDINLLSNYSDIFDLSDLYTVRWLKENFIKENNEMSNWINVKEKLPEDDKVVLIFVSHSTFVGTSRTDHNYIAFGKYYMDNQHDGYEWWKLDEEKDCLINGDWVRYWMPLPEMPGKYTGER